MKIQLGLQLFLCFPSAVATGSRLSGVATGSRPAVPRVPYDLDVSSGALPLAGARAFLAVRDQAALEQIRHGVPKLDDEATRQAIQNAKDAQRLSKELRESEIKEQRESQRREKRAFLKRVNDMSCQELTPGVTPLLCYLMFYETAPYSSY